MVTLRGVGLFCLISLWAVMLMGGCTLGALVVAYV